jgi:hypothetical protein
MNQRRDYEDQARVAINIKSEYADAGESVMLYSALNLRAVLQNDDGTP